MTVELLLIYMTWKKYFCLCCVILFVWKYVKITLTSSTETYKKFSQLVSTSNKRPLSGGMKKEQKRVGIYCGNGLDIYFDQRWTVKINNMTLIMDQSTSNRGVNINLVKMSRWNACLFFQNLKENLFDKFHKTLGL